MDGRNFYHSFPRLRPGDKRKAIVTKGLNILRGFKDLGLIMAPEIVEWNQPLLDGTHRITRLRQKRMSFTELERSQVFEHGKKFGPFSLEFDIELLRRMGALPVIYMPQGLKVSGNLSNLGTMIVTQLGDVKYTITQLQHLSQVADPEYALTHALFPPGLYATSVAPDYTVNLKNPDEQGQTVFESTVPAKSLRDIIQYIGFKNAPFDIMIGILSLIQTLFYPTDDEIHDDLLSYYRQREWRIAGGFLFNGIAHGRPLTDSEKNLLFAIDKRFWSRELFDDAGSFRRIDETVVIDQFGGKPISDLLSAVLVPPQAFDQAKALFGDIVVKVDH